LGSEGLQRGDNSSQVLKEKRIFDEESLSKIHIRKVHVVIEKDLQKEESWRRQLKEHLSL
jgi:hypothetical protein